MAIPFAKQICAQDGGWLHSRAIPRSLLSSLEPLLRLLHLLRPMEATATSIYGLTLPPLAEAFFSQPTTFIHIRPLSMVNVSIISQTLIYNGI